MNEWKGSQSAKDAGQRKSVDDTKASRERAPGSPRSKQRGVSMAAVVMGLAIAGVVTVLAVQTFNTMVSDANAQAAGNELTTIVTAVGKYYTSRRSFVGIIPDRHLGIDYQGGNLNVMGDGVCAGNITTGVTVPAAGCTGVAATALPTTAATQTAGGLIYDGFDSMAQCESAFTAVADMAHVNEGFSGCAQVGTTGIFALDLGFDPLRR